MLLKNKTLFWLIVTVVLATVTILLNIFVFTLLNGEKDLRMSFLSFASVLSFSKTILEGTKIND